MIPVKFLRINPKAIIPKKTYRLDSCFDLFIPEPLELNPQEFKPVRLGFKTALPKGFEVIMRPRAFLSGKGFIVHNNHIDAEYRGEWIISVSNITQDKVFKFKAGERIAQCSLQITLDWDFQEVNDLGSDTIRGELGYGSSKGVGTIEEKY